VATLTVALLGVVSGCAAGHGGSAQAATRAEACPRGAGTAAIRGLARLDLPCLTGTGRVRVSAVHARLEVINVWASWCYPCRRETDRLTALHRRAGPGVLFLGVDTKDSPTRARTFLADHRVRYPQVSDQDGRFALALHLFGVPSTVVVDGSGRVLWRHAGQVGPREADELMARIRAARAGALS
jgi:cytochrome c biogenesis protein CcmG, thiol:disulfide interchange protein DsbE